MDSPEENEKPSTTLPGIVEKIIKPIDPSEPEKAQITIEGDEDLYREIRVKNTLKNEMGEDVTIKEGASVDVIIEADEKDTAYPTRLDRGFPVQPTWTLPVLLYRVFVFGTVLSTRVQTFIKHI
jgi:predicted DNA-binding antitoxin AbrB/MazE fold protein